MKFTAYLNPFNWIRWGFVGKRLDEIIDFDQKRAELDDFWDRTQARLKRKEEMIKQLIAQNEVHNDHMDKAKMLSDNLQVLMTKALGTPAEKPAETVEPTNNGEAS